MFTDHVQRIQFGQQVRLGVLLRGAQCTRHELERLQPGIGLLVAVGDFTHSHDDGGAVVDVGHGGCLLGGRARAGLCPPS
ncbi:hypothetical protein D3C78_1544760 [compost metagenome]